MENSLAEIKPERSLTLDVAKGIGLLLVVLGHLVSSSSIASTIIFAFHMPLFFVIHGYLVAENKSWKKLFKNIFSTLTYYLLFSIIGLIVSVIVKEWRADLSIRSIVYQTFFVCRPEVLHVGQIWFLISVIWAEFICFVLNKIFTGGGNKISICIILAILMALMFVINRFDLSLPYKETSLPIPFQILSGIAGAFFIEIGVIIRRYKMLEKIESFHFALRIILFLILMSLCSSIAYLNKRVNITLSEYNNVLLFVAAGILGSLAVIVLSSLVKGVVGKCVAYFGKNSLYGFAIHSLFIYSYAAIISLIFQKGYIIMENIPILLSILGTVFVLVLVALVIPAFRYTVGKLVPAMSKKIFNI